MSPSPLDEVPKLLAEDSEMPLVAPDDRYVVLYAVSFDLDPAGPNTGVEVRSPFDAAQRALQLTLGEGRGDAPWYVYDQATGGWTRFAQRDLEPR